MSAWLATTGKRMCGNAVLLAIVGFPCFKRGKTDWQSSIYPKYLNGMACVPGFVYIFKFSSVPTLGFPNLKPQHTNWQGPTFPTRIFPGTHFSHPDFFRDPLFQSVPTRNLIFQGPTFSKCSHPEFFCTFISFNCQKPLALGPCCIFSPSVGSR